MFWGNGKLSLWFLKKRKLLTKIGFGSDPPPLLGLCPKFFRFFKVTPPLRWAISPCQEIAGGKLVGGCCESVIFWSQVRVWDHDGRNVIWLWADRADSQEIRKVIDLFIRFVVVRSQFPTIQAFTKFLKVGSDWQWRASSKSRFHRQWPTTCSSVSSIVFYLVDG